MKKERSCCKKIIFMGTPEIATNALNALTDLKQEIVLVITQPDSYSKKNKAMICSDVKNLAIEKKLPYIQPEKISDALSEIEKIDFDYIVTCAYGQFVPDSVLLLAKENAVNVHASLLPKYRGGAPIHWAVINGDEKTGISLIKMIKKMDAGEIYFQEEILIDKEETTQSLFKKMGKLIYDSLINNWNDFLQGKFQPITQNENEVSFALNIKREDEKINWNKKANEISNFVRGLFDKPYANTTFQNTEVKIIELIVTETLSNGEPGKIISITKEGIEVATKDYNVLIKELKIAGKNKMTVSQMINGKMIFSLNSFFI